jgi:outer membrane protein OmpA-like peptidoglycan-associated protein
MIFVRYIIFGWLLFMLYSCQSHMGVVENENIKIFAYNDYDYTNDSKADLWRKNIVTKADATFSLNFIENTVQEEDLAKIKAISSYLASHENIKVKLLGHANAEGSVEYSNAMLWAKLRDIANYFEQNGIGSERISIISLGDQKFISYNIDGKSLKDGVVEVFYAQKAI